MNIIYTICGDGLGHAFRSSIVMNHLVKQGHRLVILTSGRAYTVLRERYATVREISGLTLIYKDNRVRRGKTLVKNVAKVKDIPKNIKVIRAIVKDFKPDVVISDFEPAGNFISTIYNVPLISIDNNHVITDTKLNVKREDATYYFISRMVIDALLPNRDFSIITSFFYPPLRRRRVARTWLVPPLVRDAIQSAVPTDGDHILVYQTSDSYKELLNILKQSDQKFIIYNGNRELKADNLIFREFDPQTIVDDMAKAKAVIANGGFTFISESLFLGKPVLSIPIKMQYEQILNGRMIEEMALGQMTFRLTSAVLEEWVARLPEYKKNVAKLHFDNSETFRRLDMLLNKLS